VPDTAAHLAAAMDAAMASDHYHGEGLHFASAALFFSRLTEKRWQLIHALQGAGEMGVRELARRLGRDVKRVHDDAQDLALLGVIEKTESGKLVCPFADIHVDMHLRRAA
jgi:predicted transcriptional regulator